MLRVISDLDLDLEKQVLGNRTIWSWFLAELPNALSANIASEQIYL